MPGCGEHLITYALARLASTVALTRDFKWRQTQALRLDHGDPAGALQDSRRVTSVGTVSAEVGDVEIEDQRANLRLRRGQITPGKRGE